MTTLKNFVKRFVSDERGLETVEYAIIGALITLAAISAISLLGTNVAAKLGSLASKLS